MGWVSFWFPCVSQGSGEDFGLARGKGLCCSLVNLELCGQLNF